MENIDIRYEAKRRKVWLYEIADWLRVPRSTFMRRMKKEIPSYYKDQIFNAIDAIAVYKAERGV